MTTKTAKKTTTKSASKTSTRAKKVNAPEVDFDVNTNDEGPSFVFMEKTFQVLDIGFNTERNIILYGLGGHGKSEATLAYFNAKGIEPYVITMGTGLTTDRLFGGIDIPVFNQTGKLEYLVENSFMNHEYVIFEELFDAPDFILEQLKDILSSGKFRNGGQVFDIKTKFIVCCTNKTREEFAKNNSLKALMERFPLEHNVIWDNYTDIAYNTLLETRYGVGNVDPVIPYILSEYTKASITISPRIALVAYDVYQKCGPDSLQFIAEFSKKPDLIKTSLKKYKDTETFRTAAQALQTAVNTLDAFKLTDTSELSEFNPVYETFKKDLKKFETLKLADELVSKHAEMLKSFKEKSTKYAKNLKILESLPTV